jgi:propanol-preferring alcohol dehydrogenase
MVGADGICEKQQVSGYTCPGTFQEFVLAPAHYVTPIPEGVISAAVAPLLCGGVTAYSALRKSAAQGGDWVVVAGAGGGLGHLALQFGSRGMGYRMIALDIGAKEELTKSCGAEVFIDILKNGPKETTEQILKATGGKGASAVVICSASNAAYANALDYLKFNGTLVCVGVPAGDLVPIANAYPCSMVAKQLKIVGSTVGNRREAIETLEMAKRGVVKTHYRTEKLENANSIFEEMKAGKLQGRVVIEM